MKFQYVQQKHEFGCAPACAAMIVGKTYDQVIELFENDFNKGGIEHEPVRDYICDHNFSAIEKLAHGYSDIRVSNKRMVVPFADIHLVRVLPFVDSKTNHCLVMDSQGTIFDPARPDNKEWDYYFVCHVLGFFKEDKMPLPKARKGAKKKARQKVVSKVMHELSTKGSKKRSQKQKVAIALKQAGLSRRRKK